MEPHTMSIQILLFFLHKIYHEDINWADKVPAAHCDFQSFSLTEA